MTLSLALTGEDGAAEPTGSMTLAATQVTVPAARDRLGRRSCSTPRVAGPGAYSAVVTATPDDGGGTVRTAVAYQLEPERYDVKVTIKPRERLAQRLPPAGPQRASASRGSSSSARSTPRRTRRPPRSGCRRAPTRTGAISFGLGRGRRERGRRHVRPDLHRVARTPRSCSTRTTAAVRLQGRQAGRRRRGDPRRRLERRRRLHRLHLLRRRRPRLRAAVGAA